MRNYLYYILILFSIFPLFSCQQSKRQSLEIDNKSYINNFELIQENPLNQTSIVINSPKAIIDPLNNDIEIFNSVIKILNHDKPEIEVKSGNSFLNNSKNLISAYNNVLISLLDSKNSYIKTNSFDWDINKSYIDLDNNLDINFENTKIISTNGSYTIDLRILDLNNIKFDRSIFNNAGQKLYQIKIESDNAKWYKDENSIEFSSNNRQVESTIDFLSIE